MSSHMVFEQGGADGGQTRLLNEEGGVQLTEPAHPMTIDRGGLREGVEGVRRLLGTDFALVCGRHCS